MTVQELIKQLMACDPNAHIQATTDETKWGNIIGVSTPDPPPGHTPKPPKRGQSQVFLLVRW